MKLSQVLFSQGFGSRHECVGLILSGHVKVQGRVCQDPFEEFTTPSLVFELKNQSWPYHEKALVVMNKPQGVECSQKPKHHPSVYSLLPSPLRRRDVQSIGRLDEDTTGLLLFTDDGALIHRLTSPKKHVPKIYEVQCKYSVSDDQIERLLAGVELVDDPATVKAVACELTGPCSLRMTLIDGKYHQVKRMLAAVSNRVEGLHRSGLGALRLDPALEPGQWQWITSQQILG
jgi:16S rRNA pseudouridine516 synthase